MPSTESELIPCPNKCGAEVKTSRLLRHRTHHCPARLVPCPDCGTEVKANSLPKHRTKGCSPILAPSQLCHKCNKLVPHDQFQNHIEGHYYVPCKICDELVETPQFQVHMDGHELEPCKTCGEFVAKRDLFEHLKSRHPRPNQEQKESIDVTLEPIDTRRKCTVCGSYAVPGDCLCYT